ncbi:MAG: excinuclease ABC subunit UvrB [Candidatus Moraniibacteriota bacterium]|nr:MAG: excinuclease ABC subunit UvrB [Candidatus Moranbacteria bacterium]
MSRGNNRFHLKAPYEPAGDQPGAIEALLRGLTNGEMRETLLGVTGSGKTFTAANVIARWGKPTLVIAHNKTLAAQLAQEYQDFFPDAAVHYFVSYYDFYQPEAYIPASDTYIEKDAAVNVEIERLRHASTQALLTRRDTIIVASVSCIYGLGSPEEYERENMRLETGMALSRSELLHALVDRFFERTTLDLTPGTFRAMGNRVEVMPVQEKNILAIELEGDRIVGMKKIDPVSQTVLEERAAFFLFPAKHFVTSDEDRERALHSIRLELEERLEVLHAEGKILEADRLKRRTKHDLSMIEEIGYTNGIENYSRHLSGKAPGEPPETLLSYFPKTAQGKPDFLTIIDESHVTLPQLRGMYAGDQSRKRTLVEHGFRLPSALDNRPLRAEEFRERVGQIIFTSATPGEEERTTSARIVEQVIRPTGLLDPVLTVRPVRSSGEYPGQVRDFIREAETEVAKGNRVIATTLTKKMAEDLAAFLKEKNVRAEYLHSDIKTIDRIRILTNFRKGDFDCLVGVNLLREGLDLPEVTFIGILDADKEGFLRSETSLIQTIGRAARNVSGRVTLYADAVTGSLERSIAETNRRRKKQLDYNEAHGITPETIRKEIRDITDRMESEHDRTVRADLALDANVFGKDREALLRRKEREMKEAVKVLDFETAAILRDEIRELGKGKESKRRRGISQSKA